MFQRLHRKAILAASGLVVLVGTVGITGQDASQTTGSTVRPQAITSLDGRDLFALYCASCHGRTGVGDGPVVPALKVRPPDLTTLARRHGGVFPGAQVGVMLSGPRRATLPAHGSDEMPVWGPIFRALDPGDSQAARRVANLVLYLESLQVK
jgi:mono/diheme cytochrome c family protein